MRDNRDYSELCYVCNPDKIKLKPGATLVLCPEHSDPIRHLHGAVKSQQREETIMIGRGETCNHVSADGTFIYRGEGTGATRRCTVCYIVEECYLRSSNMVGWRDVVSWRDTESEREEETVMPNSIQHERTRWATMTAAQLETRLGRIKDPVKLMHFATLAWESGIDELIELVRLKGESLGIPLPRPLTAKKEEKEIKTILEKAKVDNKKFGGNLNRDGQPRRRLKRL